MFKSHNGVETNVYSNDFKLYQKTNILILFFTKSEFVNV